MPEAELPVRPGPHTVTHRRRGLTRDLWRCSTATALWGEDCSPRLPAPRLSILHPVAVVQLGQWHLLAGLSLMATAPCRHCLSSCAQTQRHNTQHTLHGLPRTLRTGLAGEQTRTCPGPISVGIERRLDTTRRRRKPGSLLPSCQCCVGRKARSSPPTCGVSIRNGTDRGWTGHCCSSPG